MNIRIPAIHKKRQLAVCISVAVLAWLLSASPSSGQDRVALLIANSDYSEHKLPVAKANVEKLAESLESAGFTVTVKENIEKDFRREFESFLPTCPNGGVSLVYYCGYASRYDRKMSRTIEKPDGKMMNPASSAMAVSSATTQQAAVMMLSRLPR